LAVLVVGVLAGSAEEIFFRGYMQSRLVQRLPRGAAVLVTAFCFGGFHLDLLHGLLALILGLYLGWLTELTGSALPAAVCRVVNNAPFTNLTPSCGGVEAREANAAPGLAARGGLGAAGLARRPGRGARERVALGRGVARLEAASPVNGDPGRLAELFLGAARPVAFTGAGVSTESGIPDFRSPGGLWDRFDPSE